MRSLVGKAGLVVVGFAGAVLAGAALAQPGDAKDALPKQDQQAMMEAWVKAMTPGAQHEKFKEMEGDWECTMRVWMEGPQGKPTEEKGSANYKVILGGRYLQQTFSGSMMGMPFEGVGLTGFDNIRKQFVGTWADSMSTTIMRTVGGISPDGKTMTMFGEMDEPMTGEMGKVVKYVSREISKDKHVFEAHEVMYGEPFKVFEIEYTRIKK
ncbi:MAG: DUF1579 domain-containing protein [Planctomycetota bacterium]|nr:DUF1579 domain-containing protein [Planctomycetota bacterium]